MTRDEIQSLANELLCVVTDSNIPHNYRKEILESIDKSLCLYGVQDGVYPDGLQNVRFSVIDQMTSAVVVPARLGVFSVEELANLYLVLGKAGMWCLRHTREIGIILPRGSIFKLTEGNVNRDYDLRTRPENG